MRWLTSCCQVGSPATMAKAAAMRSHMVRTALGRALDPVRQVLWAAVWKCYTRSGVNAHLGELILMLLDTGKSNLDRSFAHGLRAACAGAAPALLGDGRPPPGRRRPLLRSRGETKKVGRNGNPTRTTGINISLPGFAKVRGEA